MVVHSPDTVLARSHDERRPAIWPWIVMPLVVLVVFCILYNIRQTPDGAAATTPAAPAAASSASGSGSNEP